MSSYVDKGIGPQDTTRVSFRTVSISRQFLLVIASHSLVIFSQSQVNIEPFSMFFSFVLFGKCKVYTIECARTNSKLSFYIYCAPMISMFCFVTSPVWVIEVKCKVTDDEVGNFLLGRVW